MSAVLGAFLLQPIHLLPQRNRFLFEASNTVPRSPHERHEGKKSNREYVLEVEKFFHFT